MTTVSVAVTDCCWTKSIITMVAPKMHLTQWCWCPEDLRAIILYWAMSAFLMFIKYLFNCFFLPLIAHKCGFCTSNCFTFSPTLSSYSNMNLQTPSNSVPLLLWWRMWLSAKMHIFCAVYLLVYMCMNTQHTCLHVFLKCNSHLHDNSRQQWTLNVFYYPRGACFHQKPLLWRH